MSDQLLEALAAGAKSASKCSVGNFIKSLPDDEREAVLTALRRCKSEAPEDSGFNFSWLSSVLEDSGRSGLKPPALRRHMRGECNCDGSTR